MSGIIVDGVGYTAAQVRRLILERHELATEVAVLRATLRRRSAALNRVAASNDRLRVQINGACKALAGPSRKGW